MASILYVSSIIQTPMEIIKRMERMIFKFLWKGPDKVTRNYVTNSVKNGGLNLMDIKTQIKALRLSWIPRILDSTRLVIQSQIVQSVMQDCQYDLSNLLPECKLIVHGPKITYNYCLSRRF